MTGTGLLPRLRALPLTAGGLALAFALAHVLLWGGGFALSRLAPPLDGAEQLVWSYAMEGGYWKHPPLPSWIMHGLVAVFGPSVALTFVAVQACVALALLAMWRLGCEFMTPQRSLLAMGLTALVGYHTFEADAYNHNTVLLPFQAGAMLFFFLATRRGRWYLWALFGLCTGLALLVKYVTLFPLAALLAYFALDRSLHHRRAFAGLVLAGAIAALVFAPHVMWLRSHDWMPLQYARALTQPLSTFADSAVNAAGFLLAQVLRVLPLLLALGWLVLRSRGQVGAGVERAAPNDRLFLWIAGVGPLLLLVLYALATRTPMMARWGANAFLLAGWLALDALGARAAAAAAGWRAVLWIQLAVWTAVVVLAPLLSESLHLRGRSRFPGAQLASLAQSTWQARTGTPLRIVISDTWLAGNVVAHTRPLAVVIDGEPAFSPWVGEQDIARCGALVLQDRSGNDPPLANVTRALDRAGERGEWTLPWTASAKGEVRIAWGILPPAPRAGCPP